MVLVKRSEKVGADEPKTGPLFVKDVLLYPNLGEAISKGRIKRSGSSSPCIPGRRRQAGAVLELIQNGKSLAQVPLPLDALNATGTPAGRTPAARRACARDVRAESHRQTGIGAGRPLDHASHRQLTRGQADLKVRLQMERIQRASPYI
jgi:hypothetical protein